MNAATISAGAANAPATGVYGRHAPIFRDAGLPSFPVDMRHKRPAVRNWQRPSPGAVNSWLGKHGDADGLGVLMGVSTGITEIDVDVVGPASLAAAVERFGESPVVIETASGKSKLWYRHAGEGRNIRPIKGLDIDILGAGFTVAPPSRREDLGSAYRFVQGGLEDLARLPKLRPGSLETHQASSVAVGYRNSSLWRWAMTEARRCDDVEALMDAAETWAAAMPAPLSLAEIRKAVASAWRYETSGRNFLGLKRPAISTEDKMQDELADAPEAFFLLSMFRRFHRNRGTFSIAPRAMSEAGSPPWHYTRIANARDVLLERGALLEVRKPVRGHRSGLYRLAAYQGGEGVL